MKKKPIKQKANSVSKKSKEIKKQKKQVDRKDRNKVASLISRFLRKRGERHRRIIEKEIEKTTTSPSNINIKSTVFPKTYSSKKK